LVEVEGLVRAEAERVVSTWDGPVLDQPVGLDKEIARLGALRLWGEATPVPGTLAARYLSDVRKIDLSELPADVDATLRFHPHCPFGPGTRHPCLLALMRELSDTPTGIQRIALTPDARKIERRMMGQSGIVKLWSAGPTLVAGEGLETVLAAATRVRYRGAPLRPAWAATSAGSLSKLPVISGVERLIILLDHDDAGRTAASSCTERWTRAGRTVVRLIPKRSGADFNDMIMEPI
jgi:hypothetical protein